VPINTSPLWKSVWKTSHFREKSPLKAIFKILYCRGMVKKIVGFVRFQHTVCEPWFALLTCQVFLTEKMCFSEKIPQSFLSFSNAYDVWFHYPVYEVWTLICFYSMFGLFELCFCYLWGYYGRHEFAVNFDSMMTDSVFLGNDKHFIEWRGRGAGRAFLYGSCTDNNSTKYIVLPCACRAKHPSPRRLGHIQFR